MTEVLSIGLLAKTGRAVAIALLGPPGSPRVLERRELALCAATIPGTFQPYHTVLDLPWPDALEAALPLRTAIEGLARESLAGFVRELASGGRRVVAIGIVGSLGRDPGRIANPHIRAHAAEGQLFRHVLELAASAQGLPSRSFSPKDLLRAVSEILHLPPSEVEARVRAAGQGVVRPWRTEERAATTAAWTVLGMPSGPGGG